MMNAIKLLLQSRKFLMGVAGVLAVVANDLLGKPISEEQILGVLILFSSIILGIAYEDGNKTSGDKA
jgi:drug/metabolite transporter (DMT)-like permease